MAKRGRKSGAELSVAEIATTELLTRPEPPYELWRDEEQAVWRRVVEDVPGDWFSGRNLDLLAEYCTTVVSCRRIAQLIHAEERAEGPLDTDYWMKLLRSHAQQSGRVQALATSMRLSQQSTYTAQRGATKLNNAPTGKRPWE